MNLEDVLSWKGNYQRLEKNHAYIQWLFPNFFDSKFNDDAQALTHGEAALFRMDERIARLYVKSYRLFLDFIGLRLTDELTGAVCRVKGGSGRLRKALLPQKGELVNHNQNRVRRVLASLAVVGFRRYLSPLIAHLEWEISGEAVSGEAPVLKKLAKPFSKSEKPFLYTLKGFVDGDDERFMKSTGCAKPEDLAESMLFRVCICCNGSGVVVLIGVCPLCNGAKIFD